MDGKSDSLKIHMEFKNKSTTMNHNSKEGLISRFQKFDHENPGYTSVIGYVHDSTNRETSKTPTNGITIYYLGGNSLFQTVFGEYSDEIQNFVTNIIISFYEKKGYPFSGD